MIEDEDEIGDTPCFAHKIVAGHVVDAQTARDVAVFRAAERQRLYGLRKKIKLEERDQASGMLAHHLDKIIGSKSNMNIAAYWPIRGEFDLRGWMEACHSQGATLSLPVVTQKAAPVEFHEWTPESEMKLGVWNIPVPISARPVVPDIVIVPLLGVDKDRFRLGNGGGYYDRTLAQMPGPLKIVGVGHESAMMKTIFPMPWDIPMDVVVLSDGTVFCDDCRK